MTEWFPGYVKPVHIGMYERAYKSGCNYHDWWDGKRWLYSKNDMPCVVQTHLWRGLADKPA